VDFPLYSVVFHHSSMAAQSSNTASVPPPQAAAPQEGTRESLTRDEEQPGQGESEVEIGAIIARALTSTGNILRGTDDSMMASMEGTHPELLNMSTRQVSWGAKDTKQVFPSVTVHVQGSDRGDSWPNVEHPRDSSSTIASHRLDDLLDSNQLKAEIMSRSLTDPVMPYKDVKDLTCNIYFPRRFEQLRGVLLSDQDGEHLQQMLSESKAATIQGGKRGTFFITPDSRLIIKMIEKPEMLAFSKFASDYFDYLNQCHESRDEFPTTLVGLLGAFTIKDKKRSTLLTSSSLHVVLMENLFQDRTRYKIFDLKGCNYGRIANCSEGGTGFEGDLSNMLQYQGGAIHLDSDTCRRLHCALDRDTKFLESVGVIDYSLLLGIDETNKKIVLGIVDYCREYGVTERAEKYLKKGRTVTGPVAYRDRFLSFVKRRFVESPHSETVHWVE